MKQQAIEGSKEFIMESFKVDLAKVKVKIFVGVVCH